MVMAGHGYAVLYALLVWWFSTGVVLYLDGLPRWTFRWSMGAATLLLIAAFAGLLLSSGDTSSSAAYLSFTCGLLAWGWQEMSYYTGFITGTYKTPCPQDCSGWRRFFLAIQTSIYHELAIVATAALIVALTWDGANQVGTWTFMILWWMRWSAKLNVFLGVRNLNIEWLPEHLQFLGSFFTKKPMNLLFPVSVTVSTIVATLLVQRTLAADASEFEVIGLILLATLLVLAILEHWFLVLPVPVDKLWSWGLKSHKTGHPVASSKTPLNRVAVTSSAPRRPYSAKC
jgi:putative photosynthetic complex assembly protein 2